MSVIGSNILAGASGQGGYFIDRSVRLRSSASAYLSRTPASAGNRKTWTWSGWVKRGKLSGGTLISAYVSGTYVPYQVIGYNWNSGVEDLFVEYWNGSTVLTRKITSSSYRDPSAWAHICIVWDTSNSTAEDRCRIYVNGVRLTSFSTNTNPPLNQDSQINNTQIHHIGLSYAGGGAFDGYLTEVNFVDGQALTPSSFGENDAVTGVWKAKKYVGTYGTNGFYLNFSDNSNNTATTIGKDYSGNGNNWTPNNISVTSGVTYDSMTDVPTLTSETAGNYAVLNPLRQNGSATFSQGNLAGTSESGTSRGLCSTIVLHRSEKWYMEWTPSSSTTNWFGVTANEILAADINTAGQQSVLYYANGTKWVNGSNSAYGSSYTTSTIGVAFDGPAGTITFYRDNVSQGAISLPSSTVDYVFCMGNAGGGGVTNYANFGQRPFAYTPPTGFKALNTFNLPDSTIVDGSTAFNAVLFTGNYPTGQSITGVGFAPDLTWFKSRSVAEAHNLVDSVRGAYRLRSNTTDAETSATVTLDSDGFTVGSQSESNNGSMVAWNWKAGGTAVSNTDGSITSSVSANTTSGFSVVTWTGTGSNATVGHGLGVAPSLIINKPRNSADNWISWHTALGATGYIYLNLTNASNTASTVWNSTLPTSSVFSVGTSSNVNSSGQTMVSYCFAEVPGFSKFGSYTGNGSADGPFVFCGFRPAFVMVKRTDSTGDWIVEDSGRNNYNLTNLFLLANSSTTEGVGNSTNVVFDFLSNGFKLRGTAANGNANGGTYVYACFSENPFKNSLAR